VPGDIKSYDISLLIPILGEISYKRLLKITSNHKHLFIDSTNVYYIDFAASGTNTKSLFKISDTNKEIPSKAVSGPIWLSATTFGVAAEDGKFYSCAYFGSGTLGQMENKCVA